MTEPADNQGQDGKKPEINEKNFHRLWRGLNAAQRDIDDAATVQAEHRAVKRGVLKRGEGQGFSKRAVKILEGLAQLDEDERITIVEQLHRMAAWAKVRFYRPGSNLAPQGMLLPDGDDPEMVREREKTAGAIAETDGWNTAAAGGEGSENRHQPGTAEHAAWARGHQRYRKQHANGAGPDGARKRGGAKSAADAVRKARERISGGDAAA